MLNRRNAKRRQLIYYLPVLFSDTEIPAGNIVDITHEGMMLVHTEILERGEYYAMRINLPQMDSGRKYIDVMAHCRWIGPDSKPGYSLMGFQFVDMKEKDRLEIMRLIMDYKLDT
ncbi:MAG: PilZ domain-containing protein [Fibrobacteres bacterium]|nr:PilZ domain-containing protein [Fibrobacterota bacterium]